MPLIDRIGIDIGTKHSVEDGLRWAATFFAERELPADRQDWRKESWAKSSYRQER